MRVFNPGAVPRPKLIDLSLQGIEGALDLEIGAGQGLHAVQYCRSHPDRTLIALERTKNRFAKLESRRDSHPELGNLKIIRADAMAFVTHFVPQHSLEKVFLLYPNPYPKNSQANLRWHRSPFIQFLHGKMKYGATLNLATNLEWYAKEAVEWLCFEDRFKLVNRRVLQSPGEGRTHFERKYLARGESCFDLIFEKGLH